MGGEFGRGFGWNGGFGGYGWNHGFGWRGRCWDCGFGWGLGWGFGLGWGLGFGWGGWWNPWWWGGQAWDWGPAYYDPYWDWPPYGYPAYPTYNGPFDYPYNNDYNAPANAPSSNYDSTYGPYSDNNGYTSAEPGTPLAVESEDTNPVTANVAVSAPTVLVYLKDGTMLVANDYWLDGGQFHYTVKYGGESQVALDQVDVQKSIDENAKRGVKFTLKPRPAVASETPASGQSAPASSGATTKPNAKPAMLPAPPVLTTPAVAHAMPQAA